MVEPARMGRLLQRLSQIELSRMNATLLLRRPGPEPALVIRAGC